MADEHVLLFAKQNVWSQHAIEVARMYFGDRLAVHTGTTSDPLPDCTHYGKIALVLSFLSPWIIPENILARSRLSLNFHPASCDYPGTGCYNFALYEQAATYGSVCHHMLPKVDTGAVISECLFPVLAEETVETLKFRTMVCMLAQFQDVVGKIHSDVPLVAQARQWSRKPFTRRQLNALCEITPDMSEKEKSLRIRATTYPNAPGPYLLKDGTKHPYPVPNRAPLA